MFETQSPARPAREDAQGPAYSSTQATMLFIAQNLIGRCDNSGIFAIMRPDRANSGHGTGNDISNNIFAKCDKSAIVFLNANNEADGNLYAGMPTDFQGYGEGDAKQYADLSAWRSGHGWDNNSLVTDAQVQFDPDTLELTISTGQPLPKVPAINQIETDILGQRAGETRVPGPLADPGAKRVWKVDPREEA